MEVNNDFLDQIHFPPAGNITEYFKNMWTFLKILGDTEEGDRPSCFLRGAFVIRDDEKELLNLLTDCERDGRSDVNCISQFIAGTHNTFAIDPWAMETTYQLDRPLNQAEISCNESRSVTFNSVKFYRFRTIEYYVLNIMF